MAGDAMEDAFYYSLTLAQQGVTLPEIHDQLLQSGWRNEDIQHILYRVKQQLAVTRTPQTVANDQTLRDVNSPNKNARRSTSEGHVSKALRQVVLNMTDDTLDLAKVNFMGPVLLFFGGLILLAGMAGLLVLVAANEGESIKMMQFPVIIGVTFVKAGIDTYFPKKN